MRKVVCLGLGHVTNLYLILLPTNFQVFVSMCECIIVLKVTSNIE